MFARRSPANEFGSDKIIVSCSAVQMSIPTKQTHVEVQTLHCLSPSCWDVFLGKLSVSSFLFLLQDIGGFMGAILKGNTSTK